MHACIFELELVFSFFCSFASCLAYSPLKDFEQSLVGVVPPTPIVAGSENDLSGGLLDCYVRVSDKAREPALK